VYLYIQILLSESGAHYYAVSRYYGRGVPPGSIRRPASQPRVTQGVAALIWTGRHFFALPHHAVATTAADTRPFALYGTAAAVLVFICRRRRRRVIRPARAILYILFCNAQTWIQAGSVAFGHYVYNIINVQ